MARLEQRLAAADTPAARAERLETEVAALARQTDGPYPSRRVREALARLRGLAPGERVSAVARALGVTTRSLHREIAAWTGLPPKLLARIFRLQAALARVKRESGPLALLAAETGYADQAHMARDFRALAG
ncbi:MAG TPA: helix-turn-helix domain-containing protein, partial [Geminicoccaceae bacterium]|nr:helix-turn-helix domain-containing protein [Geminicoccaceae bacterium]